MSASLRLSSPKSSSPASTGRASVSARRATAGVGFHLLVGVQRRVVLRQLGQEAHLIGHVAEKLRAGVHQLGQAAVIDILALERLVKPRGGMAR